MIDAILEPVLDADDSSDDRNQVQPDGDRPVVFPLLLSLPEACQNELGSKTMEWMITLKHLTLLEGILIDDDRHKHIVSYHTDIEILVLQGTSKCTENIHKTV